MWSLVLAACLLLCLGVSLQATPLDDYVWKYDENYKWVDLVSGNYLICYYLFAVAFSG
jgi:hypothetical protein